MNNDEMFEQCSSTYSNQDTQTRPKNCQELRKKCNLVCSTNNPLDRIKYHDNGCCVISPIPTTFNYFQPICEPLFSKRTTFQYQNKVVEVVS